jgi:predicted DNA-binding transcriptional regulator AlpA
MVTCTNSTSVTLVQPLPPEGLTRWNGIKPYSPVSRETFRKLVKAGKAPQPIHLSTGCTAYKNSEVLSWLADPANYCVEVAV